MQLSELEKEVNSLDQFLEGASEEQVKEIKEQQENAYLIINIARQTNSQRHREVLAPRQTKQIKRFKEQLIQR
jgi:vacuolar-type H+-ATPase subunit H